MHAKLCLRIYGIVLYISTRVENSNSHTTYNLSHTTYNLDLTLRKED